MSSARDPGGEDLATHPLDALIGRRPAPLPGWLPGRWSLLLAASLAALETVPAAYYSRVLAAREPAHAAGSFVASFVSTAATYLALMLLAPRGRWGRALAAAALALHTVLLQVIDFGIHREFEALPTPTVADFARQNWRYARALFVARLDAAALGSALTALCAVGWIIWRGAACAATTRRAAALGIGSIALATFALTRPPFLSISQHAAWLVSRSLAGPGQINAAWVPERVQPPRRAARYPANVVVFRLEEIAAWATSLARPELPSTPHLKALVDSEPEAAFVASRHFSNATATDVSVLSLFTGLSPAAPLEAHRTIPTLWDYFAAAGYDTSLFLPDHLEWGDFRRRFEARPGKSSLHRVVDAGNSGHPLVYDHSLNDDAVLSEALAYQRARGWAEPFLQIISLRMPHAIGEGARHNGFDYGPWPAQEPAELFDYYDGIAHDDQLMRDFIAAMPEATRERTTLAFVSDHGTRLFARSDGAGELHRLDNYHQETTLVPFVLHVPSGARRMLPAAAVDQLRANLARHATSNIDLVPTLLGLAGIARVELSVPRSELLVGRDLTAPIDPTAAIVQLNTGPLRRWDREHFALVTDDGAHHYLFGMTGERLYDLRRDPRETRDRIGEPESSAIASRCRALASEVPELLRVQQKYAPRRDRQEAIGTFERPVAERLERDATLRIPAAPASPERALARLELDAVDGTLESTFALRVLGGTGALEWYLSDTAGARHVSHVDGLESGVLQRTTFRWRPAAASSRLTIELRGASGGDTPLVLGVEQADTQRVMVEMSAGLALRTLRVETRPEPASVHGLERFTRHPCSTQPAGGPCPPGFLVWGPYVDAAAGTMLSLRYDLERLEPGAEIWLDIAADAGAQQLARSRVYSIREHGQHSFALAARLGAAGRMLEGRLNVGGAAQPSDGAIRVVGAELSASEPAPSR